MMNRFASLGVALLLFCPHALRAGNPPDIDFHVRFAMATRVYHLGESIELEISYSSQAEKKYYGSFAGPSPESGGVTPHLTPDEGVIDLRGLREGGAAGSIVGGVGYVGRQPVEQQMDLGEWYRFQRPGYYSVTITSSEVSRVKSAEEGGGLEHLTLESDPLDFEILPSDTAWSAAELGNIEQQIKEATNAAEREQALRRLARLDTPASVLELVQFYLTSTNGGEDWIFDRGLHESSEIDVIIPALTAALSDVTACIPSTLPQWLADLETRKELGVMASYPSDPASQQKWSELWKARSKVHDNFVADANARLTASIERRSGPERATAIYQAWYDATQLNGAKAPAPEVLLRLESDVLDVADELDHARQVQFVVLAWQTMPHDRLLPMIRKLAEDSIRQPPDYDNHEPFRLWCEGWPDGCSEAIVKGILETHADMDRNIVLMMSEAEHPELDGTLAAQLRKPANLHDAFHSQRMGAAVLRSGSRNLVSAVDSFLDQASASGRCDGETEGDLVGFLFRVASEDGEKRLSIALQGKNDYCASQVLRTLHTVRPSDDIIPVVTRALDSTSLRVGQLAALYIGEHGPASTEPALWRRLENLRSAWQGRASELPDEMMPSRDDPGAQAAMLEQALASALAHAASWKLTPDELDRLRSGCLTKTCRDIVEGKLFLSL